MFRNHRFSQNLFRYAKQCYSTQTAAAQDAGSAKLSVLPNGLRVASVNEKAPLAQFVLLVNSGSRDENSSNLGITHCLQCAAGLTGAKNTAFLTTQLLSSLGAELEVTANREHTLYSVRCQSSSAQEIFTDVVVPTIMGAKFPWWEVDEVCERMKYQKAIAESEPCFVVMDNAHKASFRGTLGNSVISPNSMLGKHTSEMLQSRFNEAYTADNMVLAGSGLSHEQLIDIATSMEGLKSGFAIKRSPSGFVSSEVHVGNPSELVHAALSFNGVSLNDKDAVALSVLQHALGTKANISYGSGVTQGVVNAAVEKSVSAPFSTSAFSVNYSDAGLFGIYMVSSQSSINQVMQAVAAECKNVASGSLSDAQVGAAKARLKAAVLMEAESARQQTENIAMQTAILGTVPSSAAICGLIDGVTTKNVADVAKRVVGGKKSLSSFGRGIDGPYLQDL